jgi:hypothetical protein
VTEDTPDDVKPAAKADHEPPPAAETSATWSGGGATIEYTASA